MSETITVSIAGKQTECSSSLTYGELVEKYQDKDKAVIVAVQDNYRLRELSSHVEDGAHITFVTTASATGQLIYKRSIILLMLKAVYDIYGKNAVSDIKVLYSISKGYYCTAGNIKVDDEFISQISKKMHELVERKLPITKRSVNVREAIKIFDEYGMGDKVKLLKYRRSSNVNLYSIEGFENYFYGYMVPNTDYLWNFELKFYEDGFVFMIPKQEDTRIIPEFKPLPKLFQIQKTSTNWGELVDVDSIGALNEKVAKGQIGEMILVQEALQEKKIAQIAEMIAKDSSRKIVMIAGPSSSGKTTFSHRLSVQLMTHGLKPHPIPVDDYFVNREDSPVDEFGNKNYECLEAIDVEQFNEDMTRLLAGEKVELPTYNFITGEREYGKGRFKQLGKNDILVIEGIHCLNDKLSYRLPKESKFKIYISALTQLNIDEHNRIPTTDGRLIRRMVRDARTRGTSAAETIARWYSVRRGEEENIFPYQEDADVMFNSALIYELAVLKQYAEPILFGIDRESPEYAEANRLLKFLGYFVAVGSENIPTNSILREFVGGGCFNL